MREIKLGSHLRLDVVTADNRLQNIQNAAAVKLLQLLHHLQLLRIAAHAIGAFWWVGQQLARIIQYADRRRREFGHAG